MAIKNSNQGSISFSEIKDEFGDSNGSTAGISLGKYRVSETYGEMANMPLDEGIPQSGAIGMSDFYGKKLNIVVNYYSGDTENRPNTGKERYQQNNKTECVGEFKDPPKKNNGSAETAGSKVWLHVNKTIGSSGISNQQQQNSFCAFRTGNWESNTDLRVHVGNEGYIAGKGGQGGQGGDDDEGSGGSGFPGTSAIGIQFSNGTTILTSNPQAVAGGGGGGGGGGGAARQEDPGNDRSAGGGGGGAGNGLPGGDGGEGGDGDGRYSGGGEGGKDFQGIGEGGAGGDGGDNDGEARGGDGGEGGGLGQNGVDGESGSGNKGAGPAGVGGAAGNWIRTSGNQVQSGGWQGQTKGQFSSGDVN